MPTYKQRDDIPAPLLAALKSDAYEDSLDSHFESLPANISGKFQHAISVTTLPRSPRQRILWNRHQDKIEIDPEDKFWSLLGRIIHSILQSNHGFDDVVEERLGMIYPLMLPALPGAGPVRIPIYLHGCADLYSAKDELIQDWKFTKSNSMLYGKEDHESQLNVLAYIWRKNGRKVSRLRNVYLFRDWDARNVKDDSPYPKGRILVKDVELWPEQRTMEYIESRLLGHVLNEQKADDDLDHCTDPERWVGQPIYKVYKVDPATGEPQKMAKHTATSKIEADDTVNELLGQDWAKTVEKNNALKKPKPGNDLPKSSYIVREIKPRPIKCSYCECHSHCSQRREELMSEIQSTEEE